MSFGLRGGGFSQPGQGGYRSGGGGLSGSYNIGQSALDTASLDKYAAQTAWNNGAITDDAYLGALQAYLNATDPDSRERISAQNELSDTRYVIGRNDITRRVNDAASPSRRIGALNDLVAYDRRHLKTMVGDNQQARDLADRIDGTQAEIRSTRWNALMGRYNAGLLSTEAMIALATRNAAESAGASDAQTWQDNLTQFQQRRADETYAQSVQDYQMDRIGSDAILKAFDARFTGVSPDSPQYADLQRQREDLVKSIQNKEWDAQDSSMESQHQQGTISDDAYLQYKLSVIQRYADDTPEKRRAKDNFLNASFSAAEDRLQNDMAVNGAPPDQLISLYQSRVATLDPNSAYALDLQKQIVGLQLGQYDGAPRYDLFGNQTLSYVPDGHWIQPGGRPTNNAGFASQFDGSPFASKNCLMAATAMLAWAVTGGKTRVSGGDMRYYSGDREGGTNPPDAVAALGGVGIKARDQHVDLDTMLRMLANGTPMAITGNTANLPPEYKIGTFSGLHGVMGEDARKIKGHWYVYVRDPLGRGGHTGKWWPVEVMRAFAYAPNSTDGWVVTAGKGTVKRPKGKQDDFTPPVDSVPFQAFDTDWEGRTTLGRGGGTNPTEAGDVQDWSKGKPTPETAPVIGSDPASVNKFLRAVHMVEQQGGIADPWTPEESVQRASMLLSEFGGDARLAAVAWFTGSANPDSSRWSDTERHYANAVGAPLGYADIPRKGIGVLTIENAAPSVGLTPGQGPGSTEPLTIQVNTQERTRDLREAQTPAEQAAVLLLGQLGTAATPDMVRAVSAWIASSYGTTPEKGADLVGNNPFNLKAQSTTVYGGIVARDADGTLAFASWQDGVAAAANELRSDHPDIVAAINTGQPGTFLHALDQSDWQDGGYGGTLVRNYNQLPGATLISNQPSLLSTPTDMAGLAQSYPDLGKLFSIDPRDPAQKTWFDRNLAAMQQADAVGSTKWNFTTPDGRAITMAFDPAYLNDMVETNFYYAQAQDPGPLASPTDRSIYEDRVLKPATRLYGDTSSDNWKSAMGSYNDMADSALARGDLTGYANIRMTQRWMTERALGLPPNAPPGTPAGNTGLSPTQQAEMFDKLMYDLAPRISDPNAPARNPNGDPVLGLIYANKDIATSTTNPQGLVTYSVVAPRPEQAYMGTDDNGQPKLVTAQDTPADFAPVQATDPLTGEVHTQPAYAQNKVQVGGVWYTRDTTEVQVYASGTRQQGNEGKVDPLRGVVVDIPSVSVVGPDGKTTRYLSLGGDFMGDVLIWADDPARAPTGPQLVLTPGAAFGRDPNTGQLLVGYGGATTPIDKLPAGALGTVTHWNGALPTDHAAAGSQGADGAYLPIATGQQNAIGGVSIDPTLTPDQRWASGELTFPQYIALKRPENAARAALTAIQSGYPGLAPYASAIADTFTAVGLQNALPGFSPMPGLPVGVSPYDVAAQERLQLPMNTSFKQPASASRTIAYATTGQNAANLRVLAAQQSNALRLANLRQQQAAPAPVRTPFGTITPGAPLHPIKPVQNGQPRRNAPIPVVAKPVPVVKDSGIILRPGKSGVV